ncbi:arsenate reductase (glutaredoxin) [Ruegeria arenilitoris]|uniref:arsenate reductase (glutaredoxin) n=1 Tax=Ruegeria arenilitoris TaxID=1173585 RepID=UPI0014801F28|nr:arsenate reductase (glutaredoxin) [Ruegeria arenilitoris]
MIEYWHNPRCSKSRIGLALLEEKGAVLNIRKYLEDTPTEDELRDVLEKLDLPVIRMVRTGERLFKEVGLAKTTTDAELIRAMVDNPILIERPVGISGDTAVIGRPPENLLALL